jgi:sulfocyanin
MTSMGNSKERIVANQEETRMTGRPVAPFSAIAMVGALITLSVTGTASHGAPAAEFTIVAAQGSANGELNFNGASNGKLVITVPEGARVSLAFSNNGALPHSLQLIPTTKQLPAMAASKPAFPGAETPGPVAGILKGKSQAAVFTAAPPGRYLLICGFPGHALAGMYATFVVSPSSATKPSMLVAP